MESHWGDGENRESKVDFQEKLMKKILEILGGRGSRMVKSTRNPRWSAERKLISLK